MFWARAAGAPTESENQYAITQAPRSAGLTSEPPSDTIAARKECRAAMTTPARRQYLRIKKQHPDEVLLFRMGDFYETFDDDARLVARELEIALTSREMGRGQRIPLAGIPYHALEPYLARLVKKGYRVAICEQTSDPAESRGLVERQVVRVVTPGTVIEDAILEQKANNYLAAVIVEGDQAGLAYVDITTSEFATTQIGLQQLPFELGRLAPSELLVSEADEEPLSSDGAMVTPLPPDSFHHQWARESLLDHFGVASLEAFGCEYLPLATRSAGAVIDYLGRNQRAALSQVSVLRTYSTESYMVLDPQTRRNLELFEGRALGHRSELFAGRPRPHPHADGRPSAAPVAGPAAAGGRPARGAPGGRRVVQEKRPETREGACASGGRV